MKPIRIEKAFDDPLAVRNFVERHGPYPTMASYLPVSATRGEQARTQPAGTPGILPWFRGTWATNGRPLVECAGLILENFRFREAASQLFDGADVTPTTIVINVNGPMPAGAIHVDIPSFRGAARDRYPIQLLQAMGSSGLFEPWRLVEAGAVAWFYDGPGGEFDYWPDGLSGPAHSESQPLNNRALVADNERMYHRIGWIGEPTPKIPSISPSAQIAHIHGTGWVIDDSGCEVQRYLDRQVRISILWKCRVRPKIKLEGDNEIGPLTTELIVQIFQSDLRSRGVSMSTLASPLSDQSWLDLVHSTYYSPNDPSK